MEVRIASPEETQKLSQISVRQGNIPFISGQSIIAVLEDEVTDEKGKPQKEILGFAAVQTALHAAGSWVAEKHRRQRHSYGLREALDRELERRGFKVYFAFPANDFEKHLFAKYGTVVEHLAQIRHL